MQIDSSNTLFTLAADLVNHTSKNIFLTGKAGTGKTTFLKYISQHCPKQMAIVAPTGVAAINAGGVTIHSFFQLPFSPFIPEAKGFSGSSDEVVNRHTLLGRLRINSERRKVFQELELLIIDEISMVRCDVLDAIDVVLRHIRNRYSERFGGVQVLFIGDMYQLAPVSKEAEWRLLSPFYKSPYFFDSKVMEEDPPVYIEFNKIYRQTEENFIRLLNGVRNNNLDEEGLQLLQERYRDDIGETGKEGYTILTTHNETARNINAVELNKLVSELYKYEAETEGDFFESAYPADATLSLKVGAQVMFIKNDMDKSKRYYNGKIGLVTSLAKDKIEVTCEGEEPIEVKKEKWSNIRYSLDNATRQIREDELGSFTQYPLRLAWAITIHKSQGLTFEKVIIDAGKAFAPGQVYVALSRCTSLEGMILHSKVRHNAFMIDPKIVDFSKRIASAEQLEALYEEAKKSYQLKIFQSIFNFSRSLADAKTLQAYLEENKNSFNADTEVWIQNLVLQLSHLQETGSKFFIQLQKLFSLPQKPEENEVLQDRIKAAIQYFTSEIENPVQLLTASPAITDSRLHAKEFNELAKEIFSQLSLNRYLMQGFTGKFDLEIFHKRKNKFTTPPFGVNAYAGAATSVKNDLQHPALYTQLKKLRDDICNRKNLPVYLVLSSKSLEEMTHYLPQTLEELEKISGFGKVKLQSYGAQFLEVVKQYAQQHNLQSHIKEKAPKKVRKEKKEGKLDTKGETFRMYGEGKNIVEIAKERNLSPQTIEGHLAYFVRKGEIKIDTLVNREKLVLIEPAVKSLKGGSITSLKEKLGNDVSFGEIRLVLAWKEYQENSTLS